MKRINIKLGFKDDLRFKGLVVSVYIALHATEITNKSYIQN